MSLAELLPAIRALPKSEQVQLLHLLIDDVATLPPVDDGISEELRRILPPPGAVVDLWYPEANPEAVAAALQALKERGSGS